VDYSTLSDEALLVLIAHQRDNALHELYSRYHRLVFSLALNVVGEPAAAEEITLDVFTRVWTRADSYQPDRAQVSTWLTRIARNHAIDTLRRRQARIESRTVGWAEAALEALPAAADPAETAHLAMQQHRVQAAVGQLPVDQKEVLALAYFKGYTHSQIAEALDLPLGTVKTRIRSALQKLRQLLADEQ